jgi:hypothetical protein
MSGDQAAWEIVLLLLGSTGLFEGLSKLATTPIKAVLIILSAMFFLLFPLSSLSGVVIRHRGGRKK